MYGGEFTFHVLAREKKHGLVTENYKFTVRAGRNSVLSLAKVDTSNT